jgi:myo-inositol 2-dehydrogenase/D-chiro-inositol 1-dehydrogenase
MGKIHLENLCTKFTGVEVKAVMNPSQRGLAFAEKFDIPMTTHDVDAVFDHPEIDAVVICSPTDTHSDYVIKAARAGKAIFCEKPLDLSLDKALETLRIVKEAKVPLMLAFNQRLDPTFGEVKNKITAGKVGKIHTIHIISRDPAPPPISFIKHSGGLFMDMTIHDFDMARHLVGSKVVEVFAKGFNLLDPEIGEAGDIDTGIILLSFENNITVIIENSRKAVYGYDQRIEVFGSLGMIKANNPLKSNTDFLDEAGTHLPRNLDFFMDRYLVSYQREMEAFIDALKQNRPMPITGEDGLEAMKVAIAANKSVLENRPVKITEV